MLAQTRIRKCQSALGRRVREEVEEERGVQSGSSSGGAVHEGDTEEEARQRQPWECSLHTRKEPPTKLV